MRVGHCVCNTQYNIKTNITTKVDENEEYGSRWQITMSKDNVYVCNM